MAIVDAPEGATVVGGGESDQETIRLALNRAPILVAADGGASRALDFGLRPSAVIGDLDSLREPALLEFAPGEINRNPDQNTTDFDKCIESVAAPVLIGVGVTGPRLDHGLAALSSLVRNPGRRIVLLTKSDACFLCPPEFRISLPAGTRVSCFPMCPVVASGTGLKWPLDDLLLSPDGTIGTSNEARGGAITVGADLPGMILILPKMHFNTALDRLLETGMW